VFADIGHLGKLGAGVLRGWIVGLVKPLLVNPPRGYWAYRAAAFFSAYRLGLYCFFASASIASFERDILHLKEPAILPDKTVKQHLG
jgi:hypothetical protein